MAILNSRICVCSKVRPFPLPMRFHFLAVYAVEKSHITMWSSYLDVCAELRHPQATSAKSLEGSGSMNSNTR